MSIPGTRGDALQLWLTGAGSDGGSQSDPGSSLGAYRSSTRAGSLGFLLTGAHANLRINHVSGANGAGVGILAAASANELTWTPPGETTAGDRVTIANGDQRVIESADDPAKYVVVTRNSADTLIGSCAVSVTDIVNDVLGMGNKAIGANDYVRAVALRAANSIVEDLKVWIGTLGTQRVSDSAQLGGSGSGTITSSTAGALADWPASGFCHIKQSSGATREIVYYSSRTATSLTVASAGRAQLGTAPGAGAATDLIDAVPGIVIAVEEPDAQPDGQIQLLGSETDAPSSISEVKPDSADHADVIEVSQLNPGEWVGIWIRRDDRSVTTALPWALNRLRWSYTAVG